MGRRPVSLRAQLLRRQVSRQRVSRQWAWQQALQSTVRRRARRLAQASVPACLPGARVRCAAARPPVAVPLLPWERAARQTEADRAAPAGPQAPAWPTAWVHWGLRQCSAPGQCAWRCPGQAGRPVPRQAALRRASALPHRCARVMLVWPMCQVRQSALPRPAMPGWRQTAQWGMRLPVLPGYSARYARCRAWLACYGGKSWPLATR